MMGLVPKRKIKIICIQEELNKIVNSIAFNASTGEPGDGKIFVSDVLDVVLIRTALKRVKMQSNNIVNFILYLQIRWVNFISQYEDNDLMNDGDKKEPNDEGKIIQEHLENINMDPWYFIYQNYVNPPEKKKKD